MQLEDLCEPFPDDDLPRLDRVTPGRMSDLQSAWRANGFVILPAFAPSSLIDAYAAAWRTAHGCPEHGTGCATYAHYERPGGWPQATPYMECPELRELVTWRPLVETIRHLIGEDMGVHLNLTGWRSTSRDWHQDGYLNPDSNRDWYAAVWIALDDIDADSGPFEYVPGSHRWPTIRQLRMWEAMDIDGSDPKWPEHSERILTPLFEKRLADAGLPVRQFLAGRGDVLIWHARLLHRGSVPNDDTLERRAVIAHYSGICHRPDMPRAKTAGAGWYFPIQTGTPV